jgi:hypothetical protein
MIYPPQSRDPNLIANVVCVVGSFIIIALFLAHYALR